MSKKKLMILPIIAIVVAIMGLNVWAVPGSQQNWVEVWAGDKNITNEFDIQQLSFSGKFCTESDLNIVDNYFPGLTAKIKKLDKNLKPTDFDALIGYDITPLNTATLTPGPYKVIVKSAVGSNEIYLFVHATDDQYSIAKGGEPTLTGVTSFSPFLVFTATSKTSPQTGDFAPAYVAMIGVALLSCGAIFAVRSKKSSKVTK